MIDATYLKGRRLVPGSFESQGDTRLHPGPEVPRQAHPRRQARYKRRNRIEIMFGRLKAWRHIATRYDRCPRAFLSAVALAATVIFWL
jgi:transposase